jgi:hypothetical protein
MKKLFPLLMVCIFSCSLAFSQNAETNSKNSTKNSQATLYNEFYAGYGALSIFYFTGRMKHSGDYPTETGSFTFNTTSSKKFTEPQSVGTIYLGFARSLNKVVSVGFMFGFQNFHYTGNGHLTSNGNDSVLRIISDDRLVTGIARVTFCYLNKPYIRMYSGIGIGLTVDFGKATVNGDPTTERKLWPGGELTLMGLRVGRAFGGFLEFGFGSYGILNAGLSYKFSD